MASWYDSYSPFRSNPNFDTQFNDTLANANQSTPGTAAPGSDWFDMLKDPTGAALENANAYHQRLGQYLADHLGGAGYYTDSQSQQNLGSNVASLVNLARTKAAASGNIGATNDTTREYLKNYLKQYLTTGNMAGAVGIGGPGSTGSSYKDLYGQIAANANAASGNALANPTAANWYRGNAYNILSGLQTATDLQTGGGLRSAETNTLGNLRSRANLNNDSFWQDANGGVNNPWGGSFASNLQAPTPTVQPVDPGTVQPGATGGTVPPVVPPATVPPVVAPPVEQAQPPAPEWTPPYAWKPEDEIAMAERWGPLGRYEPDSAKIKIMNQAGYRWDSLGKRWIRRDGSGLIGESGGGLVG